MRGPDGRIRYLNTAGSISDARDWTAKPMLSILSPSETRILSCLPLSSKMANTSVRWMPWCVEHRKVAIPLSVRVPPEGCRSQIFGRKGIIRISASTGVRIRVTQRERYKIAIVDVEDRPAQRLDRKIRMVCACVETDASADGCTCLPMSAG